MRKYFYRILGCVMLLCMLMGGKAEAAEKKVDIEWKNGIVEINYGKSINKLFLQMKEYIFKSGDLIRKNLYC